MPLVREKTVKNALKGVVKSRKGRSALRAELKRKGKSVSVKFGECSGGAARTVKKQAQAMLGDLVNLVTKHLKKGDRLRIGGLGGVVVRKRSARLSGKMLQQAEVIALRHETSSATPCGLRQRRPQMSWSKS